MPLLLSLCAEQMMFVRMEVVGGNEAQGLSSGRKLLAQQAEYIRESQGTGRRMPLRKAVEPSPLTIRSSPGSQH